MKVAVDVLHTTLNQQALGRAMHTLAQQADKDGDGVISLQELSGYVAEVAKP